MQSCQVLRLRVPIKGTTELQAFEDCKASLSHATLLAHPDYSAPLAFVTDASSYEAVKNYCHMLEVRQFTIFTDHKPLIYAFLQESESLSPRLFRCLDFISQFATNLKHLSGLENVVADSLLRVYSISHTIVYTSLAQS